MKIPWKCGVKPLAISLCFLLTFSFEILAQDSGPIPTQLNIVILEGEGALQNVRQRVNRDPVIRVEDENHKPVAGAAVAFTLPTEGATGEFGNGSKTLTTMTDSAGQAVAQGLRMNQVAGKTVIHVTASYKGLFARALITGENVLPPGAKPAGSTKGGHGHGALIAVLLIVGAGAAGGAVYATQHKGGSDNTGTSTGPTPIGITPGTGSIVGGH